MRRCIIVSPHFPPSTLAGVHRARHLAKHLPAHGWQPTVICVDPRYHIERLDPDLLNLVPRDLEIVRAGAIPVRYTRPFGVAGDIGLRGYLHLRAALARQLARRRAEVVLITGSPYYPMLLAGWIRRRWGVPVVLDFQDPWVSCAGARAAFGSKAALSHRLAVMLEPRAVRNAAFITSVADGQNDEMADRYPWLDRSRMAGIPIGGDLDDFLELRNQTTLDIENVTTRNRSLNLLYAGTVWPASLKVLRAFFRSINLVIKKHQEISNKLIIKFIGTTANPNHSGDFHVLPIAKEFGLSCNVKEIPERQPYIEALRAMIKADVNLIIGSEEPHYTASKIYPMLMAGRPFLSILHRTSSGHAILEQAGGGIALAFETAGELEALIPAIAAGLARLATRPDSLGAIAPAAYAPFTAHAIAGRYASIFEQVA